ncbi:MAG TPA: pyruvate kinase [Gemmatimonadaceae bacterium]|nr:pyruvate kinase [Gemmatimonadaceae bacterium]
MSTTPLPRTKIVCTLGPASSSRDVIRDLMEAGLDVARVNFSHGTHEQHARTVQLVREVADELGRPVAILGDLQGPRIRIGDLAEPVMLEQGHDLVLCHEGEERPGEVPVTYHLANDVHPGDRILINDGLLELVVLDVAAPRVTARVVHGGQLTSHKGMNLPGVHVSAPSITDKDRADVQFAIDHDLDYLALSFVRRGEDVEQLRAMLPRGLLVVAKIEKDSALENIGEILRATDAVMVARGDLGVELPFEQVPIAQKRIIARAMEAGRPVITATQMLESMITHPRPTRAEASDVANAILDGTDAVMLSAETAAGAFPRLAVQAMRRIILELEHHPMPLMRDERRPVSGSASTEETIAAAVAAAVRMVSSPVAVVFTKSGFSARVVAARRPGVPILALTDVPRTYRQLALVWGAIPALVPHCDSYTEMWTLAHEEVKRRGLAQPGDRVIVTAGHPFDTPGTTNLLKVELV